MKLTSELIERKYRKYITDHAEQMDHIEQVIMSILDRNYDLLYDYFCNALEREEEYKILRARRCQVLFLIFLPVILKNEPDIQIHGIFISNHAIAKYKEDILRLSAVILDDIVIHGRGLQELYEELDEEFLNDNIHVYVHKVSRNADAMADKLKKKLESDSKIFDWEWRELSTQLVNVIQATAAPYVSFVEAYISSRNIDLEKADDRFIIYDNTNNDQKRVGAGAYVIFEKDALPSVFQSGGYDACIRCYESKKMKKAVYMPYVFMKAFSKGDIRFFCVEFAKNLKNKQEALKEEVLKERDNDLNLRYRAYLVNVLLNRIYSLYLDNKYNGIFDFSVGEWATLAMCFGDAVANDIEELKYDDIRDIMDLEFDQTQCDEELEVDQILVCGLEEAREDKKPDETLPLYFYFNRQLDEDSVRRGEKRKKGLSIKTFYNKLDDDIHRASSLQLKSWDSGIAASDIFVINNKVVSLYARAGEQSFRYISDNADKLEEMRDRVENISKQGGGESQTMENKLFGQFLSENGENLDEWKVPKIYC